MIAATRHSNLGPERQDCQYVTLLSLHSDFKIGRKNARSLWSQRMGFACGRIL